ncbi:MAG: hypothetical protein Q8L88_12950 [Bacteroidota bacterium]|nr:hypothetical protein [Bacteroidota bacterium]
MIALCIISFILQFRFFLFSDIAYLAADWFKDDAFYYLQPAWQFKQYGFFTFDGLNFTYGFQPLWIMIVTVIASITSDKILFFQEVLIFSSLLYCIIGFQLYRLMQSATVDWYAMIPSVIWLFNYDLLYVFVSGKESILFAFLLIIILRLLFGYEKNTSVNKWIIFQLGVYSGLLILTRVNMILFLGMLICFIIITASSVRFKKRIFDAAIILTVASVIILPWIIYSLVNFGTLFPNSGTAKLIGANAAIVYKVHDIMPFLKLEWLEHFISNNERILLSSPENLFLPSLSIITDFFLRYVPAFSYGFGLRKISSELSHTIKSDINIVFYVVIFILLTTAITLMVRSKHNLFPNLSKIGTWLSQRTPLIFLFIFAIINGIVNGIFLPRYLHWSIWYAVPELLSYIIIAPFGLKYFITTLSLNEHLSDERRKKIKQIGIVAILLISFVMLTPKKFVQRPEFQSEAWLAHEWMDVHINPKERVGAWSSGLLGYFSDGSTIINLDGLANSPKFTDEIYRKYIMLQFGVTKENRMWEYIQQNNIRYIADADFERHLQKKPFLNTIPVNNYKIIYSGSQLIDWNEIQGKRRFVIIHLLY